MKEFKHLARPVPNGEPGNEYPTLQQGLWYFNERFAYIKESGVILDKVDGMEYSQTQFQKEIVPQWMYQFGNPESPRFKPIVDVYVKYPDRVYLQKKVYLPGDRLITYGKIKPVRIGTAVRIPFIQVQEFAKGDHPVLEQNG